MGAARRKTASSRINDYRPACCRTYMMLSLMSVPETVLLKQEPHKVLPRVETRYLELLMLLRVN